MPRKKGDTAVVEADEAEESGKDDLLEVLKDRADILTNRVQDMESELKEVKDDFKKLAALFGQQFGDVFKQKILDIVIRHEGEKPKA